MIFSVRAYLCALLIGANIAWWIYMMKINMKKGGSLE